MPTKEQLEPWTREQLSLLKRSKANFDSKEQAIHAYSAELESIAASRFISVPDLLALAESSQKNFEDLDRALTLSSFIFALKK